MKFISSLLFAAALFSSVADAQVSWDSEQCNWIRTANSKESNSDIAVPFVLTGDAALSQINQYKKFFRLRSREIFGTILSSHLQHKC
jgi:hypothetical protein